MAVSYTSYTNLSGSDTLMQTLLNILTSSGWQALEINTSSQNVPNPGGGSTGYLGREFIVRTTGTAADPTNFYLAINRNTEAQAVGKNRVHAMGFAGVINFSTPVQITTLSRGFATAFLTASTSTPHNLVVGDHIIVNGNENPLLNEGWGGSDDTVIPPTTAYTVKNVDNATTFRYATAGNTILSANGGYVLGIYNPVSTRSADPNSGVGVSIPNANHSAYIYCDEFRVCGVIQQVSAPAFQSFYFGETARDHVPKKKRDRAFITSAIGPGAITASLNRNTANIRVGQTIWFIHPSGTIGSGSFEKTIVTSKPTSSSFGCVLSSSYPSGSLVGEDPLPVLIMGGKASDTGNTSMQSRLCRFMFHSNATVDSTFPLSAHVYIPVPDAQVTPASVSPDKGNFLAGRYIHTQRAGFPSGLRGRLIGMVAFATGPQTDLDIIRTGFSGSTSSLDYKAFTSINSSAPAGWSLGLGPNAV